MLSLRSCIFLFLLFAVDTDQSSSSRVGNVFLVMRNGRKSLLSSTRSFLSSLPVQCVLGNVGATQVIDGNGDGDGDVGGR